MRAQAAKDYFNQPRFRRAAQRISTISHDAAGLRPISMNQEGFCHGAAFQPRCSVNQGGSR